MQRSHTGSAAHIGVRTAKLTELAALEGTGLTGLLSAFGRLGR
jgi:hypothetical protein